MLKIVVIFLAVVVLATSAPSPYSYRYRPAQEEKKIEPSNRKLHVEHGHHHYDHHDEKALTKPIHEEEHEEEEEEPSCEDKEEQPELIHVNKKHKYSKEGEEKGELFDLSSLRNVDKKIKEFIRKKNEEQEEEEQPPRRFEKPQSRIYPLPLPPYKRTFENSQED